MQKSINNEYLYMLPTAIKERLAAVVGLTEIRLRLDKRLAIQINGVDKTLDYVVRRSDIDSVIATSSKRSIYACQDSLSRGYLPCDGGARIGVCGEGVSENGRIVAIKNIQSLVVRIPHEIRGCADSLRNITSDFKSTLIVSPPSSGKTTLLREMVRVMASEKYNILLLDERGEVSASSEGVAYLDVGERCDITAYTLKANAYESAVRSMNPDIIATDEIFGASEVDAIIDVARSGVKALATIHGASIQGALNLPPYDRLRGVFSYGILLSKTPKVGSIKEVIEL